MSGWQIFENLLWDRRSRVGQTCCNYRLSSIRFIVNISTVYSGAQMKTFFLTLVMVFGILSAAFAQDTTIEPDEPSFAFQFPVAPPTDEQIKEAINCIFEKSEANDVETHEATAEATGSENQLCEVAKAALVFADERGNGAAPSKEEVDLFLQVVAANAALPQRLELIAAYFNAIPLVAPPSFTDQPITEISIDYTFSGLGDALEYHLSIEDANENSVVSGQITIDPNHINETTPESLSASVDSDLLQAFAPALQDLMPIENQFSMIHCYDYYPDWHVTLTFEDGTMVEMVTNKTNLVGIGGPWQMEIAGQTYMQYSAAISNAIVDLFEALKLEFGKTKAMYCGGIEDPIYQVFPSVTQK
jgi:hypothetical protein